MKSGIYKILNRTNGKCYIGSAVNISRRIAHHISKLRCGKHHNKFLQNSWNKNGENNFEFSIVEFVNKKLLIEKEQKWIDFFEAFGKGYNLRPIADSSLGVRKTEQQKNHLSLLNQGRIVPEFVRNKISIKLTGRKTSEETRKRLSLALTGKTHSTKTKNKIADAKRGLIASEKTREKMSASQKMRWSKQSTIQVQ